MKCAFGTSAVVVLIALSSAPKAGAATWETCWDKFTSAYGTGASTGSDSFARSAAQRQYDADVSKQRELCDESAGCVYFYDAVFATCTKAADTYTCTQRGTTQCLRRTSR